VNCEIKLLIIL